MIDTPTEPEGTWARVSFFQKLSVGSSQVWAAPELESSATAVRPESSSDAREGDGIGCLREIVGR